MLFIKSRAGIVFVTKMSFWLVQNLSVSKKDSRANGNDKQNKIFNPKLGFLENMPILSNNTT